MAKKKPVKKKVPVKKTDVKAVKLVCKNCGEEEIRVLYCNACDGEMDIVEIVEMDKDDANGSSGVVHDKKEPSSLEASTSQGMENVSASDLLEEEENVMEKGLSDIFPGGDDVNHNADSEIGDMSMDDVIGILDQE